MDIQDLGMDFLMSSAINIAFEVESYTFKNRVLILLLQKVEKHQ